MRHSPAKVGVALAPSAVDHTPWTRVAISPCVSIQRWLVDPLKVVEYPPAATQLLGVGHESDDR